MKTVELPDSLYEELAAAAERGGFPDVAALLAHEKVERDRGRWLAACEQMDTLREQIYRETGEQPDSTPLLRESRECDAR